KAALANTKVLHQASGVQDATTTWHPLFRKHPVSGRTSIFLSTPKRCVALSGHEPAESERIIAELYAFAQKERFVYRHHWQSGDVLLWDNRCTMHRGDHSATVGNRVLHRGMVAGEVPVAATVAVS
ncbi:MAG: TauD/TfdA family dioxygenase, partial [Bacteroidota bacterium]